MDIQEYQKLTKMKIREFCEAMDIDESEYYRYRKRTLRVSLVNARRIHRLSQKLVTLEELGYSSDGKDTKLPWTLKELAAISKDNGQTNIHDIGPTNALGSATPVREEIL